MTKVDEVLETISSLTVLELSELLKEFEEKFGVTAAAPVAAAAPAAGGDDAGGDADEGGVVELVLTDTGGEKIKIIKEVRSFMNVGLKEAKDLVEATPATLLKDVPAAEAQKAKEALEALGATLEIK